MVLPLANTIKAPHLGEAPLKKVLEKLDNLIPTIDLGIDKIYRLKDIALESPSKVDTHLMKRLKISKKVRDELQA